VRTKEFIYRSPSPFLGQNSEKILSMLFFREREREGKSCIPQENLEGRQCSVLHHFADLFF